jgi:hypothetical protein
LQHCTGISDRCGVLLEVEWEEHCCEPQVERLVPVCHRTNVLGLQSFLRDKFAVWAGNGRCVEEIWNNFKNIIFGVSNDLFHIKYWEKIRTLNTTIRK